MGAYLVEYGFGGLARVDDEVLFFDEFTDAGFAVILRRAGHGASEDVISGVVDAGFGADGGHFVDEAAKVVARLNGNCDLMEHVPFVHFVVNGHEGDAGFGIAV